MNKQEDMMKIVCNEAPKSQHPIVNRLEATYDTSEIYDNPGTHMTVRGMFRYVGVDVIV